MNSEIKKTRPRPLSPHLQIYKPLITSVTSITHRFTGIALCGGLLLLTCWLLILAFTPIKYDAFSQFLSGYIGKTMLVAFSAALYYHLCNGIRHLLWDAGKGFELKTINVTGPLVILAAAALTIFTWGFAI